MKHLSLIIGALLFSTLFYRQDIGLNQSLFSLLTIIILVVHNKNAFHKPSTLIISLAYIVSAIATFMYVSTLAIITNSVVFFTLVGHISEHKSSLYVNWLNGSYTLVSGAFHRYFKRKTNTENEEKDRKINILYWTKLIGLPLLCLLLFSFLYKNGNPIFNDLISRIDFSFINVQLVLLAGFGYYLLYNISEPIHVNPATQLDLDVKNVLTQQKELNINTASQESHLGVVLLSLLNVLIVIFLITDISYLIVLKDLNAAELSQQVHSGINALILSIIMAIVIILFFFRGQLNFYEKNKRLKALSYVWIILNVLLIFSTALKNYEYMSSFGLTYKRIGVCIYLLLALIGLLSTFKKVLLVKNLWYLIRYNTSTAFIILVLSCTINWDKNITRFNVNYAELTDYNYLTSLSNNNSILLKKYADSKAMTPSEKSNILDKYYDYKFELENKTWQEMRYDNLWIKANN